MNKSVYIKDLDEREEHDFDLDIEIEVDAYRLCGVRQTDIRIYPDGYVSEYPTGLDDDDWEEDWEDETEYMDDILWDEDDE